VTKSTNIMAEAQASMYWRNSDALHASAPTVSPTPHLKMMNKLYIVSLEGLLVANVEHIGAANLPEEPLLLGGVGWHG
jgi:hypothetical protein